MANSLEKRMMWLVFAFVVVAVGLMKTNQWLQNQVGDIESHPINTSTVRPLTPSERAVPEGAVVRRRGRGEVTRKTRLSPDRMYEINIFYQGGEEIARNKVSGTRVVDVSGDIPDGKVNFANDFNDTHGEEFYMNGKRHGSMKVYYAGDALKQEAYYQFGNLVASKEYYNDGIIRMEEDYSDARDYKGRKEVGVGKVYFRDGTLKYEWYLVQSDPLGYSKSYNQKGQMVAAVYYNEDGQEVASPNMVKRGR